MTEIQLVSELSALGHIYLAGLSTVFTIVSAYVVALYFFLHRAPFALKATAFVFFTLVLLCLGLFLAGAAYYMDALAISIIEKGAEAQLSTLGRAAHTILNNELTYLLVAISLLIGSTIFLALFYLTFFYKWPSIASRTKTTSDAL